uniref:Putative secreted protein n=1 Tax=Amblyomma triste TaxID=251400 RepID=A0A023G1I5_AMBTT
MLKTAIAFCICLRYNIGLNINEILFFTALLLQLLYSLFPVVRSERQTRRYLRRRRLHLCGERLGSSTTPCLHMVTSYGHIPRAVTAEYA